MVTRFEWDPAKAASNLDGEQRWQTTGMVEGFLLLLVAHTVREEDENGQTIEAMRIISACPASRKERRRYEQDSR
jgi:uncharacterized protein